MTFLLKTWREHHVDLEDPQTYRYIEDYHIDNHVVKTKKSSSQSQRKNKMSPNKAGTFNVDLIRESPKREGDEIET